MFNLQVLVLLLFTSSEVLCSEMKETTEMELYINAKEFVPPKEFVMESYLSSDIADPEPIESQEIEKLDERKEMRMKKEKKLKEYFISDFNAFIDHAHEGSGYLGYMEIEIPPKALHSLYIEPSLMNGPTLRFEYIKGSDIYLVNVLRYKADGSFSDSLGFNLNENETLKLVDGFEDEKKSTKIFELKKNEAFKLKLKIGRYGSELELWGTKFSFLQFELNICSNKKGYFSCKAARYFFNGKYKPVKQKFVKGNLDLMESMGIRFNFQFLTPFESPSKNFKFQNNGEQVKLEEAKKEMLKEYFVSDFNAFLKNMEALEYLEMVIPGKILQHLRFSPVDSENGPNVHIDVPDLIYKTLHLKVRGYKQNTTFNPIIQPNFNSTENETYRFIDYTEREYTWQKTYALNPNDELNLKFYFNKSGEHLIEIFGQKFNFVVFRIDLKKDDGRILSLKACADCQYSLENFKYYYRIPYFKSTPKQRVVILENLVNLNFKFSTISSEISETLTDEKSNYENVTQKNFISTEEMLDQQTKFEEDVLFEKNIFENK